MIDSTISIEPDLWEEDSDSQQFFAQSLQGVGGLLAGKDLTIKINAKTSLEDVIVSLHEVIQIFHHSYEVIHGDNTTITISTNLDDLLDDDDDDDGDDDDDDDDDDNNGDDSISWMKKSWEMSSAE